MGLGMPSMQEQMNLRGKSSELSSRTNTDVLWEVKFSSLMEITKGKRNN